MLEMRNIFKEFDGTAVLKHVDLNVEKGELVAILGPSGCGNLLCYILLAVSKC